MILPPKVIHPTGEPEFTLKKSVISALIADTFNGKKHIEINVLFINFKWIVREIYNNPWCVVLSCPSIPWAV